MYTASEIHDKTSNLTEIFKFTCELGLPDKTRLCKTCKKRMKIAPENTKDGLRWQCNTKKCNKVEVTIRKNSRFEKLNTKMRDIIQIIYERAKSTEIKRIKEKLGVEYKVIDTIFEIIRARIKSLKFYKIGGTDDCTVKIYETACLKESLTGVEGSLRYGVLVEFVDFTRASFLTS